MMGDLDGGVVGRSVRRGYGRFDVAIVIGLSEWLCSKSGNHESKKWPNGT